MHDHSSPALIEVQGLSKRFGGTQAISDVDLSLGRGEVHGLVGENGAGKSTLGRCLAGAIRPDSGTLKVDGRQVAFRSPRDALELGFALVEQELSLVAAMTVTENILLGASTARWAGRRARTQAVQDVCKRFKLDVPLGARVETLSAGDQQKVEILRALAHGARLLVMDEPTARLDKDETRGLLRLIKQLSADGAAVVLVSHFLEDVLEACDRITVMRDGRVVKSSIASEETQDSIVEAMIGRTAELAFPAMPPKSRDGGPLLEVQHLSDGARVRDVSLTVHAGEIVGLGGLVGSGRTEVAQMIFGARRIAAGQVWLAGEPYVSRSVRHAIRGGIAYVPESRKDLGLLLDLTAYENVTLPGLKGVSRFGLLQRGEEIRQSGEIMDRLGVLPADPRRKVGTLSGGNQQKVLFGKWLHQHPRLLIADEPTRGVDIRAKFAIYELLGELASQGLAVLLISSEVEELIGLAHRVVVLSRGRSVAVLSGDQLSEERFLHAAFDHPEPYIGVADE